MKNKFFISFLIVCLSPIGALAAEMVFSPASINVGVGDLVKVGLYVIPTDEPLNASAGKLIYPSDMLSVSSINYGNSVLSFWPEEPKLTSNGVISYSGVTPGGFSGATKYLLFNVVFKSLKEGNAELYLRDVVLLKNDGTGGEAKLSAGRGQITITTQSINAPNGKQLELQKELDFSNDKEIPESFTPLLGRDEDIFEGRYFVVFSTTDKLSGIDHYEVSESKRKSVPDSGWVIADSPYPLIDQTLESYVFVKAYDKAGNTRVEMVEPFYTQKFYHSAVFWVIIILVGLSAFFYFRKKFTSSMNDNK